MDIRISTYQFWGGPKHSNHSRPANLYLPLNTTLPCLTPGPEMITESWILEDIHIVNIRDKKTWQGFLSVFTSPCSFVELSSFCLSSLYNRFFPATCPVNFKLQHQTQWQQSSRDCLTSSHNCVRSKPCILILHFCFSEPWWYTV